METTQDNGKTASIISYFSIIGWLIAYFAIYKDNKTALASYQLKQTLLFHIISMVIGWGFGFVVGLVLFTTGFFFLTYLLDLVYLGMFILWVIGLIGAINGEEKPIPLIG